MAGVIPVIYYSILLGLGLPGECRSGVWGLADGQKLGSSFYGFQSSMQTPEDHRQNTLGSP